MTAESLPHWDLSNVYPGLESEEFKQDVARLKAGLDDLDQYLAEHHIGRGGPVPAEAPALAALLDGWVERVNGTLRLGYTLGPYIQCFFATDSYNTLARRLLSELEVLLVRMERQEVLFRGWLGTVAEQPERFRAALAEPGPAANHMFYLEETARQSRYLMSAAEETLASELSLSGGRAWEKLHSVVTSQLVVPFDLGHGVEPVPITRVQNLHTSPDGELRRRGYEAEQAAWHGAREPLAACLNSIKGAANTLDRRRGRVDALHQPLDQARIDRETLETMLGVMVDSFPDFRRYFRHKAALLGKEALPWWDLFAPTGRTDKRYSFAETRALLLDEFGGFSERLLDMARRAFDRRWIDAEPRAGKVGGAFCTALLAVDEPRVLCNFDGSYDSVATLAHELGHAYHVVCYTGTTPLQRDTPMTLAETASILLETYVTQALAGRAADAAEELSILEAFLINASQVVVDIYSRYLFEKEVFERRVEAELSADEFCDIMLRAQRATYGDGLDGRYLNRYMWAWKSHYYSLGLSFYNFPYAFGLLFGLGLYAVYLDRGAAFIPEYEDLLRSTGQGTAAELAARFGIDLRDRAFWENSMAVIRQRIERYLEL